MDLVVCAQDGVLLIQRADGAAEGGRWALPGGFHDTFSGRGEPWQTGRESATQAALRELQEETGLDAHSLIGKLSYVGYFGDHGRDPRDNQFAWAVSNAFRLDLESQAGVRGLDDAQDARWVSYDQLAGMELAFDHADILRRAGLPVA